MPPLFPTPRAAPALLLAAAVLAGAPAAAATGKLLLTGGVSSLDGAAGGGLTPWALTGTYASAGEWGATAHATRVRSQDYGLAAAGVALGWSDRLELSFAQQRFDTGPTGTALGLPGLRLRQTIAGLKWRLAGDAVLDSDRWTPQLAVGLLHKRADRNDLSPTLEALGADRTGTELYASATKLFLAQGLLLNGTLRWTRANQNGLLGHGGTGQRRYRPMPEVSVAWLLRRDLALGAEWRAKPDNLNPSPLGAGLKEDDWSDVFLAWAPSKHLSLTLAVAELGRIVPATAPRRQRAAYLSAQAAF